MAEYNINLKLCPFCGGRAVIDDCGYNRYYVHCIKCRISQYKLYARKCDAVRVWNRRRYNG